MSDDTGIRIENEYGTFGMIPTVLLKSPISPNAKVLYALLWDYADRTSHESWPSRRTLAADLGRSVDRVDSATKELIEFGALRVDARARGDGGQTSNLYRLLVLTPSRMNAAPQPHEHGAPAARMRHQEQEPENKNQRTRTNPPTPQTVPPSTDVATLDPIGEAFERIWKLWPHHRNGRPKAMIAFRRALKAGVSVDLVEAAVLRDCAVWDRWPKSEHQFVPHLTTWLNDSRWDADPPADRYSKPTTRDDIGAALADLRSRRSEPQEGIES